MADSSTPSRPGTQGEPFGESLSPDFLPSWDQSHSRSVVPRRFVKFAIVGAGGVVVNLVSFVLVVRFLGWRDWKASGIATLIAIFNNYSLNNAWTFRDRMRRGFHNIRGYLIFMAVSAIGLVITTEVYVLLTSSYSKFFQRIPGLAHAPTVFLATCQLAGIACAMLSNFYLNSKFTWAKPSSMVGQR